MKLVRDCKAKIVPFSRKKTLDFGVYVDGDTIIIKDEDGSINGDMQAGGTADTWCS